MRFGLNCAEVIGCLGADRFSPEILLVFGSRPGS